MWLTIIFLVIGIILLTLVIIFVIQANKKFRDKSVDIKEGMSEEQVLEIMEKDPLDIQELKNGTYMWIYERKQYVGWANKTLIIHIIFNVDKTVKMVEYDKTYDGPGSKKEV